MVQIRRTQHEGQPWRDPLLSHAPGGLTEDLGFLDRGGGGGWVEDRGNPSTTGGILSK